MNRFRCILTVMTIALLTMTKTTPPASPRRTTTSSS